MNKKAIIRWAGEILKQKGPMSAIVLVYRLREDYAIDISRCELVQLIRREGKEKITSRKMTKRDSGFSISRDSPETLIYEAI